MSQIQLVERHQVDRLLDRGAERMLIFCRDCPFAVEMNARTLETLWRRPGAEGVHHAGGNVGLSVAGSTVEPEGPRSQPAMG